MTTEARELTPRRDRRPVRWLDVKRGSVRVSTATKESVRAVRDVRHLLRFRMSGLRGRSRRAVPIAFVVLTALTLLFAFAPAFLPAYQIPRRDVLLLLPTAYVSVLIVSIVSAAASGGGRELLPRDYAVVFPVSPTSDHLGALLMAPLNIAWLLQAWSLLGMTAYGLGATPLLPLALVPVAIWLVTGTAMAQVFAWTVEWVRRGLRGSWTVRGVAVAVAALAGWIIATDKLSGLLDVSPTFRILVGVLAGADGQWFVWAAINIWLGGILVVSVVVGAWMSGLVARKPARDELRVETSRHAARSNPATDFVAVLRTDRAGIWRSVPMRRGMVVLALFPALAAVAGSFEWDRLTIFPGLVASGGVLLFGVNSWCIDGRGALWRDSLPVSPRITYFSRVLVLLEILLVASIVTLLVAGLRAGRPTGSELSAIACATVVVIVQVVATALRWSVRTPYAVDLRSSRATPAPPLVMVGYSSRLALSTTVTGLMFGATSRAPMTYSLLLALPFLLWSGIKLWRTSTRWADPVERSRVIATVAS